MYIPPVVHNVSFESHECTTGGTRRAERVNVQNNSKSIMKRGCNLFHMGGALSIFLKFEVF